MATSNLFGQYYSNKSESRKYQNVNYICTDATSYDDNTFVISDSAGQLLDSNGKAIASIDLSKISANPITEWTTESVVIEPHEVRLINGITYGKSYRTIYYKLFDPENKIDFTQFTDWQYNLNVEFNLLYNYELILKEVYVCTKSSMNNPVTIDKRLQNLFDALDMPVVVSIEEINGYSYIKIISTVLGYDFIISSFKFIYDSFDFIKDDTDFGKKYGLSKKVLDNLAGIENGIKINVDKLYSSVTGTNTSIPIKSKEDEIKLPETKLNDLLKEDGKYDYNDKDAATALADNGHVSLAQLYYIQDMTFGSGKDDSSVNDPSSDLPPVIDPSVHDSSSDDSSVSDASSDIRHIEIDFDKDLNVWAFKYPNGAARIWFLVPEWPDSIDIDHTSLKLNHVADKIDMYIPQFYQKGDSVYKLSYDNYIKFIDEYPDGSVLYVNQPMSVYAAERNEAERHMLEHQNILDNVEIYEDEINGSITKVSHPHGPGEDQPFKKPDYKLYVHEPHIGMYRYIDWVTKNNQWLNVGQFYGLITEDDSENNNVRNLANSVFVYNQNDFPVVVKVFIGA